MINGKYGYNLAGFTKNKTSISRNDQFQNVNEYQTKYLFTNNKNSKSLMNSAINLSSNINTVSSFKNGPNKITNKSQNINLVESTYQFQEPEQNK